MSQVYGEIATHIPHLRRYAQALTHNPVAADDLVQESLLRALMKCHLYREGTNLRAWLFTILHNEFISDIRRQGRCGVPVDPDDASAALSMAPDQERRLYASAVLKAVDLLPAKQRKLMVMVAVHGLSYEEAAERTGLPLGTVKSRISRARTALCDGFSDRQAA